jgi:hypothetical protein
MLNSPKKLYQAKGKDGTYEFLGHSTGAGTDRGHDVESYRDIHTGRLFHRLPDDFATRMECIGERISRLEESVEPPDPDDPALLREALDLLEYVTWHDGRYRQESSSVFQRPAQELVTRIAKRLGVEPYQSQKQE